MYKRPAPRQWGVQLTRASNRAGSAAMGACSGKGAEPVREGSSGNGNPTSTDTPAKPKKQKKPKAEIRLVLIGALLASAVRFWLSVALVYRSGRVRKEHYLQADEDHPSKGRWTGPGLYKG